MSILARAEVRSIVSRSSCWKLLYPPGPGSAPAPPNGEPPPKGGLIGLAPLPPPKFGGV